MFKYKDFYIDYKWEFSRVFLDENTVNIVTPFISSQEKTQEEFEKELWDAIIVNLASEFIKIQKPLEDIRKELKNKFLL